LLYRLLFHVQIESEKIATMMLAATKGSERLLFFKRESREKMMNMEMMKMGPDLLRMSIKDKEHVTIQKVAQAPIPTTSTRYSGQ